MAQEFSASGSLFMKAGTVRVDTDAVFARAGRGKHLLTPLLLAPRVLLALLLSVGDRGPDWREASY